MISNHAYGRGYALRIAIGITMLILLLSLVGIASALPEFLDVFNTKYNTKGMTLDSCNICHTQGKTQRSLYDFIPEILVNNKNLVTKFQRPNNLNAYGMDFKNNLNIGVSRALSVVELLDSDKDKVSNINEINNLTFPGNKISKGGKPKNKNNPLTQVKNVLIISDVNNYQPP